MKKRSIQKLTFQKAAISALNTNGVVGGNGDTDFCQSINFCETIDYSRCNGEYYCQIYTEPQR